MRAELPWNVAGIPPEAREAARAAARREGLSVGEWLTRRILRSFSDLGEDPQPLPQVDPWGLPPTSSARRDTDDMLARVSRSETESSDVYRRIEENLRNVARRLDSAERSQSENNRVMHKTATEINITSREQAQAFDQLGGHVMSIGDRLERLERGAAQDGIKDAVKGLHQGLSRLADQITQTANQSAAQVTSLAGNLEQLATRLGQARAEAETANKALDQRLGAVEKAAQFSTNALDHALEKLEAQSTIRAGDLADLQKRDTATEVTIMRLEESIGRLEKREPVMERRLESIERSLGGIVARLDQDNIGPLQDTVRQLARRMEGIEKESRDVLADLRARAETKPAEPINFIPETPVYEAPAFEAPPFAEPGPPLDTPPALSTDGVPPGFDPADPYAYAPDAMGAAPFGSGNFEMPPEFAEALGQVPAAPSADSENFLSAARKSARAAAEAEGDRAGSFRWGKTAAAAGDVKPVAAKSDKPRRNFLIPALVVLIALVALITGVMLSQRAKPLSGDAKSGDVKSDSASNNLPARAPQSLAPPNMAPFVPALPSGNLPPLPKAKAPAKAPAAAAPAATSAPEAAKPGDKPAAPAATTTPATPQAATPPAAAPRPFNAAPPAPGPTPGKGASTDRVMQLAESGNAIAETIVGLKLLDGTGVAANPAEAGKWLQRAADKGQAVAQYRLGTMYERGQGVTADAARAAKLYQSAANAGNRKAMHNLAVAYADGALGKKDMAEAARWFSKAAALGLSDSQFNLAVLYERGDGVPQSLLDAFKWYSIAAAAGDNESKTRLGVLQTQLSETDRTAAQKSAATFHATALNRSANVPPEAADLPAN